MVELGQLEKRHQDFTGRHVRIFAVSNDDPQTARATQADFPHLVIVSDAEQTLAKAVQVLHPGAGPHHEDVNAPTTFLVDGKASCAGSSAPTASPPGFHRLNCSPPSMAICRMLPGDPCESLTVFVSPEERGLQKGQRELLTGRAALIR